MHPWIDISLPLRSGMVHWPGDIPVSLDGNEIHMNAHTGTHIDAPLHIIPGAQSIDAMPLEATCGIARVVRVAGPVIDLASLREIAPQSGERLLFRTENSMRSCRYFLKNFVALDLEGARYLAGIGVRTIGIDYLSFGPYGEAGIEVHRVILGSGIWAIEGLDLSAIEPGFYELVCLPLKIAGGDGAPARAMLRMI